MTVKIDLKHDAKTVFETLTDPQFLVDRSMAMGELDAECEVEEQKGVTTVKMVREIERDLPKLLARLFGSVQTTEFTEQWRKDKKGWRGNWTLTVRGQPVTVQAEFSLEPIAGGCRDSVTHSAKARIPVVGGQVEKFILSQSQDGAKDELAYLKDYLNGDRF